MEGCPENYSLGGKEEAQGAGMRVEPPSAGSQEGGQLWGGGSRERDKSQQAGGGSWPMSLMLEGRAAHKIQVETFEPICEALLCLL